MSSTLSQPARPAGAPFVVPTTLQDCNAYLVQLGLSRLEPAAFAMLSARESRDRLVEALRRALHGDANALAYLHRVTGAAAEATAPAALASRPTLRVVPLPAADIPPIVAAVEASQAPLPATPSSLPASLSARRPSLHVYGQRGALTVECSVTIRN